MLNTQARNNSSGEALTFTRLRYAFLISISKQQKIFCPNKMEGSKMTICGLDACFMLMYSYQQQNAHLVELNDGCGLFNCSILILAQL